MRPRELLKDFVFFLSSSRLLESRCDSSRQVSVSQSHGDAEWKIPAEDTLTLKSTKKGIWHSEVYTIYIILMSLPYWVWLVEW